MVKSFFAILGISPNAGADEIRSAYRRLAKEFHPDRYTGGSSRFHEIQEAYAVLGNTRKRDEYKHRIRISPRKSTSRRPCYPDAEPLIPDHGPADIGEISPVRSFQSFTPSVDEIFDRLYNHIITAGQEKSGRVQKLTLEITVSPEQARRGGNARIMIPVRGVCETCRGYGEIGPFACSRCAGEGSVTGEIPFGVSFPPGLIKNHAVLIPLDRFGFRDMHITVLFRVDARLPH